MGRRWNNGSWKLLQDARLNLVRSVDRLQHTYSQASSFELLETNHVPGL
jgi:hypothetical protein